MEQAVSASSGSVDLKVWSDMPLCVLVTSRTTTLLKHGIATLLVRNTQFDAADLFNNLVKFHPDGLPEAVLKEINIIATILSKLHHPNLLDIEGIRLDISWDHENRVLQNMPSLSKFQLENIEDNLIQEISSGIQLLEDEIIKSSPTVETLTLVEEAMKKLQSPTLAEQREAIEGLVAGLVAGVIDKSPLSLTHLIDMLRGTFSETVNECLQYIDSSYSKILDNGGKLEEDHEIQELLAQYKRCVNFFVGDLRCLPFKSSDMVTKDLVEMRPTAEELTLIITGYDEVISRRKSSDTTDADRINMLAREQYSLWRQANHHLAGLLDGKESGALDETTGDTKELQEKKTDLTEQEVNISAQSSSQTTPIPKHLGSTQTVPSDIPLCALIVNRIETLLVKALALHLVRKSEYNMADLIDRLSSVLPTDYGKTSIKELNIIAKITSKIQPKEAVEGQTTPGTIKWDNKHNRLENVPTGSRVQLASLPSWSLKVRCLNISLLEDVIIKTLPTVATLTLVEESMKKLQSPTPAEQIEAIEGLVAGLVAGVLDKFPLSLTRLIDMFHGEFPPSVITLLKFINNSKVQIMESGRKIENMELRRDLITAFNDCVIFLIKDFNCLPVTEAAEACNEYLQLSLTADEWKMTFSQYDRIIRNIDNTDGAKTEEINLLANEQFSLWKKANQLLGDSIEIPNIADIKPSYKKKDVYSTQVGGAVGYSSSQLEGMTMMENLKLSEGAAGDSISQRKAGTHLQYSLSDYSVILKGHFYDVTDSGGHNILVGRWGGFDVLGTSKVSESSSSVGESAYETESIKIEGAGFVRSIQRYENCIYTLCRVNYQLQVVVFDANTYAEVKRWFVTEPVPYATKLAVSDEKVYITDHTHKQITVFSTDGKHLTNITHSIFIEPLGLSVCPPHSIIICDPLANRVHKLDTTTHDIIWSFTAKEGPVAVCCDHTGGEVWVWSRYTMFILDSETGKLRQIVSNTQHLYDFLNEGFLSGMCVVEGQLWVACSSHRLAKFRIKRH